MNSLQFNLFLFYKLPAAYICGVRLIELNEDVCSAGIKYRWINQNPFKSIYFACLTMTAEMTTGLPFYMAIRKRKAKISMLLIGFSGNFYKKATGKIHFINVDIDKVISTIEQVQLSDEPLTINIESVGYNQANEIVASFIFTWSFKNRLMK
jgi:hypothetical protein